MSHSKSEKEFGLQLELELELESKVESEVELEELGLEDAPVDGAPSRSAKRLPRLGCAETHSGHNQQPVGIAREEVSDAVSVGKPM